MKNLINVLYIIGLVAIIVSAIEKISYMIGSPLSLPIYHPVSSVFLLGAGCILSALAISNIAK